MMFYRNEELADMSVLVVFGEPYASPEDKDISNSAVSFTLPQAHETVLDLVCRLLLEKKKIYGFPFIPLCPNNRTNYNR